MNPKEWNRQILPYDGHAAMICEDRWNTAVRPLHGLGRLEKAVVQMAGLTGNEQYSIDRRAVLVLCADNGVTRQHLAAADGEKTSAAARALAEGDAPACRMAAVARADMLIADMGMSEDPGLHNILNYRIAPGTGDISVGPAMTPEQALKGIQHGVQLMRLMKGKGYRIVAAGDLGMGNPIAAGAVASVLLQREPALVAGPAHGPISEGTQRKTDVIRQAIRANQPNAEDALDVLAKLGGFEIAGLTGVFIGGAIYRIPVLVDGMLSAVAALAARRLCRESAQCMIAGHCSAEPAAAMLLEAMELKPLITGELQLGAGSGALAALPLLDMAYAVYDGLPAFGVE